MIKITAVDHAIDQDDSGVAERLADLLDDAGDWDWTDDSEHDPYDRFAVIESTGAYWLVYRGTESDSARRFASREDADDALAEEIDDA